MVEKTKICCFCSSIYLKLLYSNVYHPYKTDHGPFDFYRCKQCGSGLTINLPSSGVLAELYKNFSGGVIPSIKKIRDQNPLTVWYNQCIEKSINKADSDNVASGHFNWLDVGAGNGEASLLLSKKFPASTGVAVDFNARPVSLTHSGNVTWISRDINRHMIFSDADLPVQFDLILLITVLEHVMHPDVLISNLLSKLQPGGCLYITVPDFGSWASKILKNRWPYMLPGEHLCIPTVKGMKLLLERKCKEVFSGVKYDIKVNPIILPYPAGYFLNYFGVEKFPEILSKRVVELPTGVLEASVALKKDN